MNKKPCTITIRTLNHKAVTMNTETRTGARSALRMMGFKGTHAELQDNAYTSRDGRVKAFIMPKK